MCKRFWISKSALCAAILATAAPVRGLDAALPIQKIAHADGELTVRIAPQPRCAWGDLDVIKLDASRVRTGARFLVSLESIDRAQPDIAVSEQLFFDAKDGGEMQAHFKLPALSAPRLAALFICLDSTGDGSCRGKPVYDFETLMAPYSVNVEQGRAVRPAAGAPKGHPGEDKTYFFQPLIIDSKGAEFIDANFSPPRLTGFSAHFSKRSGSPLLKEAEDLITRNSKTLGSLPLRAQGADTVQVTLPRVDRDKCG